MQKPQKSLRNKSLKILGLILTSAIFVSVANTKYVNSQTAEPFLGKANAPVTIIEYGSLTCSHCADFSNNIFPKLKKDYINTGKVKFIYRAYPTAPNGLSTGLHVIANCETGDKRFQLIETFYKNQGNIYDKYKNGGALTYILNLAKSTTGISEDRMKACLSNPEMKSDLKASVYGAELMGINSTPTLLINGKKVDKSDYKPYDMSILKPAIDAELKKTHN